MEGVVQKAFRFGRQDKDGVLSTPGQDLSQMAGPMLDFAWWFNNTVSRGVNGVQQLVAFSAVQWRYTACPLEPPKVANDPSIFRRSKHRLGLHASTCITPFRDSDPKMLSCGLSVGRSVLFDAHHVLIVYFHVRPEPKGSRALPRFVKFPAVVYCLFKQGVDKYQRGTTAILALCVRLREVLLFFPSGIVVVVAAKSRPGERDCPRSSCCGP